MSKKTNSDRIHTFHHTAKDGTVMTLRFDLTCDIVVRSNFRITDNPKLKKEYLLWVGTVMEQVLPLLTPDQLCTAAKAGQLALGLI